MAMLGGFNELSLQRSLRPWGDHMSSWSCTLGVKQEFEERNHKDLSNYQYFIDKLHPPPKKKTSFVFFVWVVNIFFRGHSQIKFLFVILGSISCRRAKELPGSAQPEAVTDIASEVPLFASANSDTPKVQRICI